ncbi:hypothetical protein J3E71DRAFT_171878 [Bipolaris maydis]|nr:hypothetical protein J3E71DRAFT_171739 [Bipolaris maydis]KAJ6284301.1 hypothetical protein J3E71DRAFT_171878 [Bipolaris maydis]
MSDPRPKLTRRRGACEECRQKKVRCNGANPCNHCQQNGSPCKYNLRRSRRCLQEKNTQTVGEHVFTTTQPYAVNGGTMPGPSNLSSYSEAVIGQTTQQPANYVDIPFDKSHFSQFVPDNVHPYPSLDLSDEMIQETGQPKNIGISLQNQISYNNTTRNSSPMLNWLDWGYDQNLHQHSTAQSCDLLKAEAGNGTAEYTLALLYRRIVVDEAEPPLNRQMHSVTILFQNICQGSRRKQAVLEKVKRLLSPDHQTCLSDLLRKVDSSREHQGLDLNNLPMRKLIQSMSTIPPSLFIKEQDVMQIQEHFVHPEKPPIDVSDMSLLMVSLAWGALLDPEVSSVSQVALLDAVLEISTMLLHQNRSVRQFLALVAALSLAEKTGSENLPALILGSVSTVASLNLHLEPILRRNCVSEEQVIQAKRALWVLYCIDKSRALRWQTFSLVDKGSLPTMSLRDDTLQSDIPTVPSLQWLEVRCQYSRICSDILQLRVNADKERSKDGASTSLALSTALEGWYRLASTNQVMLSLEKSIAARIKLQISYYYHEAKLQLTSVNLVGSQSSFPVGSGEWTKAFKRSAWEIITSFSMLLSEHPLQEYNHLFINKLALCSLALDILLESDQGCEKEGRALLSIVAGYFARVGIVFAQSSVFEEVSSLVEILTYSSI